MAFKISIGVAVLMIVLLVYCISLVVWIVTLETGKRSVNDLADRLRSEVAVSLRKRISDTLDQAESITRTNALMLKNGAYQIPDRADPRGPETDHFLEAFRAQLYGGLFVTTVSMTDWRGNLFGVYNNADFTFAGMWEQYANASGVPILLDYETYPMGHPLEGQKRSFIGATPDYNSSQQVWYTVVNFSDPHGNAWTPMYTMGNIGEVTSMISQSNIAFRADGSLVGAVTIDMATGFVSEILSSITAGGMFSFAVDVLPTNGVILGSSTRDVIMRCDDPSTELVLCPADRQIFLNPLESGSQEAVEISNAILQRYGSWPNVPAALFKSGENLIAIEEVNKNLLSWRVIIAVPESSFLEQTKSNTNVMITVQVICGVCQVALCIIFSIRVRQPLRKLVHQIQYLQRFDIDGMEEDESESLLSEVSRLQKGHKALRSSMGRVKSFIPQSLLAELKAEDDDDDDDIGDGGNTDVNEGEISEVSKGGLSSANRRQIDNVSERSGRSARSARSSRSTHSKASNQSYALVAPLPVQSAIQKKNISVLTSAASTPTP